MHPISSNTLGDTSGNRPPGDPRPRLRHRGDGPLARATLPGPQHWVVHDRDADLLDVAAADLPSPAADGAAVTVEAKQSDITRLTRAISPTQP